MVADRGELERVLADVIEPELDLTLGELGLLRSVRGRKRRIAVEVALPTGQWPSQGELARRIEQAATSVPGIEDVTVETVVMDEAQRAALRRYLRSVMLGAPERGAVMSEGMREGATGDVPGGKAGPEGPANGRGQPEGPGGQGPGGRGHSGGHDHGHGESPQPVFLQPGSKTRVIGVSSGKGGVGKSSVTVNLAIAVAELGHRVGVLDADVYGFSVPKMLGVDHDPVVLGDMVIPASANGVRCLSMGFFVPDDQPVIWRGPMLHKAIEQFLVDAFWAEPDFLFVDMPPGTGDVTLSLAQVMPRTEILVVTTPQAAAQRVAQRSAFAARKLKLSVRGVIENMSWFTGDDGKRYELFGHGGGASLADEVGVPLLGQLPLVPALREGGDEGRPVVITHPEGEASLTFRTLAERVVALGPARVYRRELSLR